MVTVGSLVPQQSQSWPRPVGRPNVNGPVLIPIDECVGPTIVQIIQASHGRDSSKSSRAVLLATKVQEGAIPFITAPRFSVLEHSIEPSDLPAILALRPGCSFRVSRIVGGLRHDLSPKETSQIVLGLVACNVTVGNNEVLPPVIIEVGEESSPAPTPHRNAALDADVFKATTGKVAEQGVPTC